MAPLETRSSCKDRWGIHRRGISQYQWELGDGQESAQEWGVGLFCKYAGGMGRYLRDTVDGGHLWMGIVRS